jgi:CheY-like chemotaxis protein
MVTVCLGIGPLLLITFTFCICYCLFNGILDSVRIGSILYIAREATSNVLRHAGASKVMIRLARIEEKLVLAIRDNGCGFNSAAPDVRESRPLEQQGLRDMAEQARLLGGRLTVVSTPGHGPEVCLEVKVREWKATQCSNQLCGCLELLRTSRLEAVAQARQCSPDVVLMDVRLPDGNGIEACRQIRSSGPGARVLISTSYADQEAVIASITAGAAGYSGSC